MDKKQLLEDKFMTAARFSQEVEKIAFDNPEMNYIDSVIHYCELNEIELDSVNKLICLLYTSPSPRDATLSRMPSSA